MKYLVFDIECADGGKATICSFGYVIADLNFNILEQRDIIINPESEFCLTGRAGRPDIVLAYTEEEFLKAPTFDKVYDEIRDLLESDEYYVIGHSVDNDVKYLCISCVRYGLPPLEFEYFDTQKTYTDLEHQSHQISLHNAILAFGLEDKIVYHRSDEDARATLLVLKSLLEKSKKDFPSYAASAYECTGRTYDFYWGWNGQPTEKYNDAYAPKFKRFHLKDIKEGEENKIRSSTKNAINFQRYIQMGAPYGKQNDALSGKRVCVSMNYELNNFKEMLYLVGMIKAAGGSYTRKVSEADIFAAHLLDANGRAVQRCERHKELLENAELKARITVTSLDSLLRLLGTSRTALSALPEFEEDYFLFPDEY